MMRELSIEDIEQVSGAGVPEALGLWGLALSVAGLAGIATAGVTTAVVGAPIAAIASLGLSIAGGWQYMQPSSLRLGTVTVGGDYRESDC